MTYKGYTARIDYDDKDEIFFGQLLGIRDVIGFHADSVADLKSAFHDAVDDYLETCAKAGKSADRPYSGRMMFRVSPEIHAGAAKAASLEGKSLNQWAEEVFSDALNRQLP